MYCVTMCPRITMLTIYCCIGQFHVHRILLSSKPMSLPLSTGRDIEHWQRHLKGRVASACVPEVILDGYNQVEIRDSKDNA